MKTFALIGSAGYIAPKHMKAIKESGNNLVASYDPNDSVGIIDTYFPDSHFFVEFERFDRHLEKLKTQGTPIDYLVVCSPNYLHDAHIRFGLRYGADVICEKPIVLNPWNLDSIKSIQKDTQKSVYSILQLRLHPEIVALKKSIEESSLEKHEVDLTYITARGNWYYTSWKGEISKSGGIATNIGIHFFDMLQWLFGKTTSNEVHLREHDRASGTLNFEKANVNWFLSINKDLIPAESANKRVHRAIKVNGNEIEFSSGFEDLHTLSYLNILQGKGYTIEDAENSIQLVHAIRNNPIVTPTDSGHDYLANQLSKHPFKNK